MFSRFKNKIQVYLHTLVKQYEVTLINQALRSNGSKIDPGFGFGENFIFNAIGNGYKLQIEDNVLFRNNCHVMINSPGQLHLKKGVFFNNYCSINCFGKITIGENTLFGEGVKIYDHNHLYSKSGDVLTVERNEFKTGYVNIGKNCWIGSNVTILNNVEIGDNVIIGANCLIYKSVSSNTVVKAKTEYIT
jgi:acetyltransferase-like isoleucine patch superfamily enzyme